MGLADDRTVEILLGALVLSLLALVGIAVLGVVASLSTLFGATPTTSLVAALLGTVVPYAVAVALVSGVSLVLSVGLAVAAVRRASMPRSERLASVARKVEHYSPDARRVGLAEYFEPTTEDRIDQLKQQYVEGEITELEYERRLQDLLSGDDVSDERVRRERERTEYEFEK